jgi:inhibitor of KinA sporulation pathway (predicted exonuclease)
MKALDKALHGKRVAIFLDLEGTQFTHEMIEIGAYSVILNDDLSVKNINQGFTRYVKAHNQVGPVVTRLTGITEKTLVDKGELFPAVFSAFHHYVSKYHDKAVYITFGNQDLRIIQESVFFNGDAGKDFMHDISRNYLDYSSFISTYVKDDNNNCLSLSNYLNLFNVPFKGQAHDALADAYNLIMLYNAFVKQSDFVAKQYEKTLSNLSHLPSPIQKVMSKLSKGEDVTYVEYQEAVKGALK